MKKPGNSSKMPFPGCFFGELFVSVITNCIIKSIFIKKWYHIYLLIKTIWL